MWQKKVLFVLLLTVCYQTVISTCINSTDPEEVQCTSLEDILTIKSTANLKNLKLSNPDKVPKKALVNDIFGELPTLQKLTISGLANKIEKFAFRGLSNLSELFLINNTLETLPGGIFKSLSNLNIFYLAHSGLKSVPNTIFRNTNIAMLDLSNNEISKIEDCAFCDMKNINLLRLHSNQLTSFEPDKVLGHSPIKGLALYENKLSTIHPFATMPQLMGVSFSYNNISKIEDYSFANLKNIQLLELSHNQLKDIPANILPDEELAEPMFIIVDNNQIKCLSVELRSKIKKLTRITIDGNPWQCQCINDVISWARGLKGFVACEHFRQVCTVQCTDGDKLNNITIYQ